MVGEMYHRGLMCTLNGRLDGNKPKTIIIMARIFIVRSPKDDSWLDEYLKKKAEYIEMEKERPTYSFDVYETIAEFTEVFNTWSTKREKVLEELEALDKREEIARVTIPTTMVGVFTSRRKDDKRIAFKELEYASSLLRVAAKNRDIIERRKPEWGLHDYKNFSLVYKAATTLNEALNKMSDGDNLYVYEYNY